MRAPLALVLLATAATGCQCEDRCAEPTRGTGDFTWSDPDGSGTLRPQSSRPLYAGDPLDLRFQIAVLKDCAAERDALDFAAHVRAPSGRTSDAFIHDLTVLNERNHRVTRGRVVFTPEEGGLHQLTARYGPALREESWPLLVFRRGSDAAPARTLPGRCALVAQTSPGAIACDGAVYRDGQQVDTVGAQVAAAGEVLWALDGAGNLTRLVDPGAGPMTREPAASADAGIQSALLLAGAEEVILVGAAALARFHFDGTALVERGRLALSASFAPTLAVRAGNAVWAAATREGKTEACRFDLGADALEPALPCLSFDGLTMGGSGQDLWIGTPSLVTVQVDPWVGQIGVSELVRLEASPGALVEVERFSLPHAYSALAGRAAPWVRSEPEDLTLVSRREGALTVFESFPRPGERVFAISPGWIHAQPNPVEQTRLYPH